MPLTHPLALGLPGVRVTDVRQDPNDPTLWNVDVEYQIPPPTGSQFVRVHLGPNPSPVRPTAWLHLLEGHGAAGL